MTPGQVADVEGVLVTVAVSMTALAAFAAAVSGRARYLILTTVGGSGTILAAGIAGLATAGSLWFSEGAGFPPCELCWYQRIAMYPLVIVLGAAALRSSTTARLAGIVFAGFGLAVSAWHNVIETFPRLDTGSCDPTNPCTIRWVEGLGFWTIPRMAAACFALILTLCMVDHHVTRRPSTNPKGSNQ